MVCLIQMTGVEGGHGWQPQQAQAAAPPAATLQQAMDAFEVQLAQVHLNAGCMVCFVLFVSCRAVRFLSRQFLNSLLGPSAHQLTFGTKSKPLV